MTTYLRQIIAHLPAFFLSSVCALGGSHRRNRRRAARFASLESRTLLAAQFTPVREVNISSAWGDTVAVINDRGTVVFADQENNLSNSTFSWRTNGGNALPSLTSGFNGGAAYLGTTSYGIARFQPDLNNSNILVLIQFTNSAHTQQELVIYDVRLQTRLITLTTAGEFKSFIEAEINDNGIVSVIAERDDGTAGIFYLLPGDSQLQPVLVRPEFASRLDDLKLLDDNRTVFRFNDGARFTVSPTGDVNVFSGDPRFSSLVSVSTANLQRIETSSGIVARLSIGSTGSSTQWQTSSPLRIQLVLTEYQTESQRTLFNDVVMYTGQSSIDIPIPGVAPNTTPTAITVDMTFDGHPWQLPVAFVNEETFVWRNDTRSVDVSYGTVVNEPAVGQIDAGLTVVRSQNVFGGDVISGSYQVFPLGDTTVQNVDLGGGTFTIPSGQTSVSMPVAIKSDDSSVLLRGNRPAFLVAYTLRNDTRGTNIGTYYRVVRISDTDYLQADNDVMWRPVPAAINGAGDFAYVTGDPRDTHDDRLILVSGQRVVREYAKPNGTKFGTAMVLSNQKDLLFGYSDLTGHWTLASLKDFSVEPLLSENDKLTPQHYAYDVYSMASNPYRFTTSSSGRNIVLTNAYHLQPAMLTSADGYGVYTIGATATLLPDLVVSKFSYSVASSTIRQVGGPVPRGSKILLKATLGNTGQAVSTPCSVNCYLQLAGGEVVDLGTIYALPRLKARQKITISGREVFIPENLPAAQGQLFIRIDATNRVEEANENNNYSQSQKIIIGALAPGAYIMARVTDDRIPFDVAFPVHQFVVYVPQNVSAGDKSQGRMLSDGTWVVLYSGIVGSDAEGARLNATTKSDQDHRAIDRFVLHDPREAIEELVESAKRVSLLGQSVSLVGSRLKAAFDQYVAYTATHRVKYPSKLLQVEMGLLYFTSGYMWTDGDLSDGHDDWNSNSWAQSLVEYAIGPGRVDSHIMGIDLFNWTRIDREYFIPIKK